jgi:hypothetical protein
MAVALINDILTCKLHDVLDMFCKIEFPRQNGPKWKPFHKCTKSKKRNGLTQCLPPLTQVCRRSRIITAKVIRLSMELVEPLLEQLPNLVLVHLVRDPRGIIMSRLRVSNGENSTNTPG